MFANRTVFAIPNPWVSSLLRREWGQLPATRPAHLLQRGPGALPDRGPFLFQGMAAGRMLPQLGGHWTLSHLRNLEVQDLR